MKNKIVKYDNEINKLAFTGFNQYDIDLFWTVVSFMKETNQETVEISFKDIEETSGIKPKDKAHRFDMINDMCFKLASLSWNQKYEYEEEGKRKFHYGSIFRFKGDEETEILEANIDKEFSRWINQLTEQFTIIELQELIKLKSKYSKTLYRILKQWKTRGYYEFHSIEEFVGALDIPKGYTNLDITQKVIKPFVKEIKEDKEIKSFRGLNYEVKRDSHKRGKPVVGYRFTWQKEIQAEIEEAPQEQQPVEQKKKSQKLKKTKFSNFNERQYDFEDLEKRILTKNEND